MLKFLMLIALIGLTTAACPLNSTNTSARCVCDSGFVCATCPGGCSEVTTAVWGCNSSTPGSFIYTSTDSGANFGETCLRSSEYCFPPSRTQSYSSFRTDCTEKYVGDFCIDTIFGSKICIKENATNPFCPSTSPNINGTFGPQCDYGDQIAGAVLALFEIVLIAVGVVIALGCGCCLAMFFCGCMCFAGRNRSTVVVSGGPGYGSNGYNKV